MIKSIWKNLLFYPFLNILLVLYAITGGSLGWAVIIIATLIRLALIPMTRRQYELTAKMAKLKPEIEKLQKKHKGNKEAFAKAQMELYKDVGYNPLGCMASFIPQFLMLGAIFAVIRAITKDDLTGVYPIVRQTFFDNADKIVINTSFMGMDLAMAPKEILRSVSWNTAQALPYIFMIILVGVSQYLATKFTQSMTQISRQNSNTKKKKTNADDPMSQEEMQQQMAKSMSTIFPLMIMYFSYSSPSVLGIYWFVQSWLLVLQYFMIDRKTAIEVFGNMFGKRRD